MNKQAMVLGLGQFGMAVARSLSARGVEVLAVDAEPERVEQAAQFVAVARCFDATDERELTSTAPKRRDVAVCAMGDESREGSIICTALLKQLGAPRIVARATDPLHERILLLVGAHEIVNPEYEFGMRLTTRLLYTGVLDEVPLGEDLLLTELQVPRSIVGRTLMQLALPKNFQVTVAAVRKKGGGAVVAPNPAEPLNAGDLLVLVSAPGAVVKMMERLR